MNKLVEELMDVLTTPDAPDAGAVEVVYVDQPANYKDDWAQQLKQQLEEAK